MPKKSSSWGQQEYIPAGNGDASGEYADENGGNIHVFSKFKKPEGKVVSLPSFDDLEKDLEEYDDFDDFELEIDDLEEILDEVEETPKNIEEKLSIEINEKEKSVSSVEEFIKNIEDEVKDTDASFLKKTLISDFKEELDVDKISKLNDDEIVELSIALNVLEDKEKFFKTLNQDKDAFFNKIYQNDVINKNQVWKALPQTPDDFITSLDKKIEYFQTANVNLEKINALQELKNSDEFKAWKTEYDELNAAYGYDFSKYQKLLDEYYNYNNVYSQKAKDGAFWFKSSATSSKKYMPYAEKVINAWQLKDPKAIEMIIDYTGSFSSINHPLRNFDYPHKSYKEQSKEKQKQFIDHVEGITKVLDSSTYDFNCWVQRGVNQLSLGEKMLTSSHSQEELDKLVGTKFQDQGFLSCGSHKGGGFASKPIVMNIYCPKGTKMLYVKGISHYGSEDETIIQRGYTYKITKVEKSGGKIYLDCEVQLGTDKNKYNKQQLEELKAKYF